jgi:HPt (histidine-containing phosphotransfer) domain-containing protein
MPELKVIDMDDAMNRVDHDRELYTELVQVFFEEYDSQIKSLEDAVTQRDINRIGAVAHSLKSALGNIGARSSQALALALEKAAKSSEGRSGDLVQDLKTEVERARAELSELGFLL